MKREQDDERRGREGDAFCWMTPRAAASASAACGGVMWVVEASCLAWSGLVWSAVWSVRRRSSMLLPLPLPLQSTRNRV